MDEDLSRAPASVYSSPLFRSATLPNSICARLPSGAVKRNAQTRSICSPFVADRQIEPAAVGVYAGLPGFNLVRIERHFKVFMFTVCRY
jgi:hypothetical protein